MRAKSGFTLVEILIVVVILGILAAIVIPQFTEASSEAKVSSLVSNLQTVRSQIQLYKIQHNDALPIVTDSATFTSQLTGKTNQDGTATGTPKYGPYLQAVPRNPFVDDETKNNLVKIVAGADDSGMAAAAEATPTTGWLYNPTTGTFKINKTGAISADNTTLFTEL